MNKNILIKGVASLLVVGTMVSCSSDYLDVPPESSINSTQLKTEIEVAEAAVTGFYRAMYKQYSTWEYAQGVGGEAWVQQWYGDVLGTDATYTFWNSYGPGLLNWSYMQVRDYWFCGVAWTYSYGLINLANEVLSGIDSMETGTPERRAAVKAQALTVRAHGYIRILQLYGARYEDSKNGSVYVAPLRLEPGTGDMPLATQKQIIDQVYSDLETAIECYNQAGFKRTYIYEADKSIAQGLFARVAILNHDWQKAYDMASAARQDYPIMSAEQYKAGFVEANQEYMWSNPLSEEWIAYWTFGSLNSCNGVYATWGQGLGSGSINYDLYKMTDPNDIRRDLYWTPDKKKVGTLRPANFWSTNYINSQNMDCNAGKNPFMTASANGFNNSFTENISKYGVPYANEAGSTSGIPITFGAQYKFWGQGVYAISQFPVMRAAEMALIEAEAAYRLGNITDAQSALIDLNSQRIDGYTCTKSGDDLWQEIMLTSRIELWGEGHSWINAKRWNINMDRNVWIAGDTNSNNIAPASLEMHKTPSDNYGWVYTLPNSELRYNHGIDESQLIATPVSGSDLSSDDEEEDTEG